MASVQTSPTTPVHYCKILYFTDPHMGLEEKKDNFVFLCVILNFCVFPVYFIKVLQQNKLYKNPFKGIIGSLGDVES